MIFQDHCYAKPSTEQKTFENQFANDHGFYTRPQQVMKKNFVKLEIFREIKNFNIFQTSVLKPKTEVPSAPVSKPVVKPAVKPVKPVRNLAKNLTKFLQKF